MMIDMYRKRKFIIEPLILHATPVAFAHSTPIHPMRAGRPWSRPRVSLSLLSRHGLLSPLLLRARRLLPFGGVRGGGFKNSQL